MSTVKVFTIESCPYCKTIKSKLDAEGIEYKEVDADENEETFEKLSEKAGSDNVPMVVVNKKLLVPDVSFTTIDNAVEQVKNILSEENEDED